MQSHQKHRHLKCSFRVQQAYLFRLPYNREEVYIKVDGVKYRCKKRIDNWVSDKLKIQDAGTYVVEIYSERLLGTQEIKITKGMEENDLGI